MSAPARLGLDTPVGRISLTAEAGRLSAIYWSDAADQGHDPALDMAAKEIRAYFAGLLRRFTVPLDLGQTPFRRRFLQALIDIPYGETRSYGDLAKSLDVSAQAIGQACGANPIPIIIPCHRVLAANTLGGFSGGGGVETKVALLRHEGAASLLI